MRPIGSPTLFPNASDAWLALLRSTLEFGTSRTSRGRATLDLSNVTVRFPLCQAFVHVPGRKLSANFAAAEALWVLEGDDQLAPLLEHAPSIAQFSDDGKTLSGAYGPKYVEQRDYVVDKLVEDLDTRQAVATLWERNPAPSKDVPCTLALVFSIRPVSTSSRKQLHTTVLMRSSDLWLGFPYDMSTFACLSADVCSRVNNKRPRGTGGFDLRPGCITYHSVSAHLYYDNFTGVRRILDEEAALGMRNPEDLVFDAPAPGYPAAPGSLFVNPGEVHRSLIKHLEGQSLGWLPGA